jgi:hypothetical protein
MDAPYVDLPAGRPSNTRNTSRKKKKKEHNRFGSAAQPIFVRFPQSKPVAGAPHGRIVE